MPGIIPKENIHDLTMLYLKKQDISDCTPAKLAEMYNSVFDEIENYTVNLPISAEDVVDII